MNLGAVREALLADARREGDELRGAASRDGEAMVAAARREAEQLLADARQAGAAEARAVSAAELARARRQAHELVLAARREVFERARAEVRRAATSLREAPDHAALCTGLGSVARGQLGADADVEIDHDVGGIVARSGGRSVDYRWPAIADRCFAALGADVEELWR